MHSSLAKVYQAHFSMRAWKDDRLTVEQFVELVRTTMRDDGLSQGDRAALKGLVRYWQNDTTQRVLQAERPARCNPTHQPLQSVPTRKLELETESEGEWWTSDSASTNQPKPAPEGNRAGNSTKQPQAREMTRAAALEL